jgi:hypothetical protein
VRLSQPYWRRQLPPHSNSLGCSSAQTRGFRDPSQNRNSRRLVLENIGATEIEGHVKTAFATHDKRAVELGALPPLDIYRSESEVASRRVQMIQAEYVLKQAEDTLRLTIGADQDDFSGRSTWI